jgi:hypothetical protein
MKNTENWHIQDLPEHKRFGIYKDEEFIGVAFYATAYKKTLDQARKEAEANAKIMAASSELLNALQLCRNWFDEHGKDYEIGTPNCFIQAKAAINKAKGE